MSQPAFDPNAARPPIVTDADRDWALAQMPPWARRDAETDDAIGGEIVDDGGWLDGDRKADDLPPPNWSSFVAEQIESFERFFAGERRSHADWSKLWRETWWPKADPLRRFPSVGKTIPQPFFRCGTPEFERALGVATADERALWTRFRIAQFKPDDPRLDAVRGDSVPADGDTAVPATASSASAPRNRPMFEIRSGEQSWQSWIDWLRQRARSDLIGRAEMAGVMRTLTRWPTATSELPFIGPAPQPQRRAAGGR